ncbi:MAG: hypothetical protein EXS15_07675 [Phycisphaerales bacterium]|nr:hypothetical protein [Phycisphaerales bacterium]
MNSTTKTTARIVGFVVGLALVVAAFIAIATSAPTIDQLRGCLVKPDGLLVLIVSLAALGSLIGSTGLFYALLRRSGSIRFIEMGKLIAASSVLNYAPMRPGLVSRIAYQHLACGIPMRQSVLSVVEAALICALTVLWLAVSVALVQWTNARMLGGLCGALPILCGIAFAIPERIGLRIYLQAIFWRWIDLLSWAVRYWAVFAMLGVELTPESAGAAAAIAGAANMIPFIGNGLGIREWAIGLAGPALATWTTDTGLAAELLNRAVDLVVVVPLGCASMPGIARRIRSAGASPASIAESRID